MKAAAATLLLPSYGLKGPVMYTEAGSDQPTFGLPFRFGKPLTFKRDLQLQHVDFDNVPDKSNQRNSVHPAGRQCSSAKQDSTHRKRSLLADGPAPQQQHLAGSPAKRLEQPQTLQHSRQQACLRKACAGQVLPLGLLAASFVRQGVSTAAAAEAVAAAAAVAHAAAQMPAPPPAPPAAQSRSAACSSDGASAVPKQRESSAEADAGAGCTLAVAGDAAGESAKATAGAALSKTAQARPSSPGPGQYTLPAAVCLGRQGPAFTMGARPAKQQLDNRVAASVPGPGAYGNSSASGPSGPAFSMAGRWREQGQEAAAPGPGQHQQLQFIPGGPAFSIPGRPTDAGRQRSSSPGPGAYGQDWDTPASPSGPAWSLGMRPKGGQASSGSAAVPGPGAYHPDTTTYEPDGPAYSFPPRADAGMSSLAAAAGPAPGDYDPSTAYSHTQPSAPAFSIPTGPAGGTALQASSCMGPGPGHYFDPSTNPGAVGRAAPAFTMGCRPLEREGGTVAWESPGPGEYYRDGGAGADGPAFSMAGRPSNAPAAGQAATPGPGHYSAAADLTSAASPAFTMAGRVAAAAAASAAVPGPGSYQVAGQGTQGPAFSIQGKARPASQAATTPGPLNYRPDPTPLLPSAPCYTMSGRGAGAATAAECSSPGPGDYEQGQQHGCSRLGPAWTMASRLAAAAGEAAGCDIPGPGYYHSEAGGGDGPAFTMAGKLPAQAREASAAGLLPGPGHYEVSRACGASGAAFTMAGRLGTILEQQEPTPGPGAYLPADFASTGSSSSPAFTFTGRTGGPSQDAAVPAVPGPGAYDCADMPRGPAYSLTGRRPVDQHSGGKGGVGPGPGAYDVAGPGATTPAWSMGVKVQVAGEAGVDDTPAPGAYHPLPELPKGPAWTLAAKQDRSASAAAASSEQPGPGHYTQRDQQGCGPAFSLGSKLPARAVDAAAAEEPGPGAYYVDGGPKGLSFTFRSKLAPAKAGSSAAAPSLDETPGPGHYHKDSSTVAASKTAPKAAKAGSRAAARPARSGSVGGCSSRAAAVSAPARGDNLKASLQQISAQQSVRQEVHASEAKDTSQALSAAQPSALKARAAGTDMQKLTLSQLNAQLSALLKHKPRREALRLQRFCSDIAA